MPRSDDNHTEDEGEQVPAFAAPVALHHSVFFFHNADCCEPDQPTDTPFVHSPAETTSESRRPLRVCAKGLPVSLRYVLQHLNVQFLLGHQLLQTSILIFERLQPLRFFRLHPAILVPPTVIRRLADLQLL